MKYYEDEHVTLYLGNCLTEHREWLEADVLVTDPPYGLEGLAGSYGKRVKMDTGGKRAGLGHVIAGDSDGSTRDAVFAMWGGRPAVCFGTPRLPEPPGPWSERLIWDKVEPGMNGGPFRYTHEDIYLRGDGWVRTSASSYSILRFPRSDGMSNEERSQHPHRKPVRLMETLIEAAPPGVIADPFSGSGSTLIAARNLGRRAVGVELEEKYCEIITKRLQQGAFDFGAIA